MDPESSTSAASRIVVVSSTLDTSREVAHRIKALSGDTSESPSSSEVIHWTIKNKYYTAPVHFHPIHLEGLESIELDDVPAVIYAWKESEPYRAHMKQVAEQTSSCNPEVSLAISMAPTTEEQLEDFFFEHGFEYVEGHAEAQDRSIDRFSGTPGMDRAVDALSTIMWPSMVRMDPKAFAFTEHPTTSAVEGEDDVDIDYRTLMDATSSDETPALQREMEVLEKWLEEDDDSYEKASVGDNNGYTNLESQEQSDTNDPWNMATPGAKTTTEGFDDDFAEFVSAPGPASRAEPKVDEDSDSDLPSEADIRAASARIFTPISTSPGPSHSTGPDTLTSATDSELPLPHPRSEPESSHAGRARNGSELDMDSPAIDLTGILGALDAMREEISRIPDMRERRRAAAKAALGLVYGLEETNEDVAAGERLA